MYSYPHFASPKDELKLLGVLQVSSRRRGIEQHPAGQRFASVFLRLSSPSLDWKFPGVPFASAQFHPAWISHPALPPLPRGTTPFPLRGRQSSGPLPTFWEKPPWCRCQCRCQCQCQCQCVGHPAGPNSCFVLLSPCIHPPPPLGLPSPFLSSVSLYS